MVYYWWFIDILPDHLFTSVPLGNAGKKYYSFWRSNDDFVYFSCVECNLGSTIEHSWVTLTIYFYHRPSIYFIQADLFSFLFQ